MASASTLPYPPNPHTTNRKDYTASIVSQPIPSNADPEYLKIATKSRALTNLLINHPAMEPNLTQTFMTPANKKSRVYFLWDFVQRTVCYLNMVDPVNPMAAGPLLETWTDALGRYTMAASLVQDPKKARAILGGDTTEWGSEVEALTKEMLEEK